MDVLTEMGKQYKVKFTKKELNDFGHWLLLECRWTDLKKWLNAKDSKEKEIADRDPDRFGG
jgi:hypothetical protein